MKKNEMTKAQKINHILAIPAVAGDQIAVEYLKNELQLLESRKNGGDGTKAAEKRAAAEVLKKSILEVLETAPADGMTATQIATACSVTSQKAVSIIRNLVADFTVRRTMVKKTPYFSLITEKEISEMVEESAVEAEIGKEN